MTTKVTHELRKGGGWVLIGTQEASNDASLTQTGLDSTYDAYCIILSAIIPDSSTNTPYFRFGDSSGIDSGGSDYVTFTNFVQEGTTTYSGSDRTASAFLELGTSLGGDANEGGSYLLWLLNPGDAGIRNHIHGHAVAYGHIPSLRGNQLYGMREAAIVLDRVQFLLYSGNITSGRMTVWGMRHT